MKKYFVREEKESGCTIYAVINTTTCNRVNIFADYESAKEFAEKQNRSKKTKIRITAIYTDIPPKMYLQQFLLLRTCEKVGDEEVVNNYQLGLLNEAKQNGSIDFEKLSKL